MRRAAIAFGLLALLAGWAVLPAQERLRRPPPIEPLAPLRLPELQSRELANGLKLWVAYREVSPIVSLHLIIGGGESAWPDKTPGLATLAAALLGQGTQSRRVSQIEEAVEAMGGDLVAEAGADAVHLRFRFLENSLDEALALVAEMILRPDYTDRAVQIAKTTVTYDLVDKERHPAFAARRHLVRLLFEGHPYGRSAFGREAIRAWTLKDFLEFLGRTFHPNNTQVLLVGNVTINTATRRVSHYLNMWPRRDLAAPPLPPPRPPARDRVVLVDLPGEADALILAGTTLPSFSPSEGAVLQVLNQILGGSLYSRLNLNLRESKGYARFATSETLALRAGGVFMIQASVAPGVLAPAVAEILAEVRKLAVSFPLPLEVEQAKGFLMANFPVSIERYDRYADRVAETIVLGAGEERWSRYQASIVGVDGESVSALGRRILSQPFVFVIAGAKEACLEHLAEFEPLDVFDAGGRYLSTAPRRKEP
ncbi:MAG: insulinase family protein [Candidatus Aminicenantes bacterium]|nr:insulinase family protein [Candidatus Aminicenantes bacterium]